MRAVQKEGWDETSKNRKMGNGKTCGRRKGKEKKKEPVTVSQEKGGEVS